MLEVVHSPATRKRTRTTSEMNTFLNCRRKYELKNVKRLRSAVSKRWSSWGTAFHRFDELYHTGHSVESAIAEVRSTFFGEGEVTNDLEESWEGFVRIAVGYANRYAVRSGSTPDGPFVLELESGLRFKPSLLEIPFKIPIFTPGGRRSSKADYAGIFDGIVEDANGALWVWETKTVATLTEAFFDKLGFDRQVLRYVYAARQIFGPRVKGVIYNAISKAAPREPTIRQDGTLSTAAVITTPDLLDEALRECRQKLQETSDREPGDSPAEVALHWDITLAAKYLAHTLHEDTQLAWGYLIHRAEQEPEGKGREAIFKKIEKARAEQAKYRELIETAEQRLFYARSYREIGDDLLEEIQWELYQLDRDIQLAEQDKRFYPNDRACDQMGGCEFRDLCLKGRHDAYTESAVRHLELPDDGFLMPTNPRPIKSALADVLQTLKDDNDTEAG